MSMRFVAEERYVCAYLSSKLGNKTLLSARLVGILMVQTWSRTRCLLSHIISQNPRIPNIDCHAADGEEVLSSSTSGSEQETIANLASAPASVVKTHRVHVLVTFVVAQPASRK